MQEFRAAHLVSVTQEEFDTVMDTNYKGAFFLSQIVAKYMIKNSLKGNILNIASSSSLRPTNSAYSMSKVLHEGTNRRYGKIADSTWYCW